MAPRSHRYQAPKGTRDFDPRTMAVRRHIESAWRRAATCHGFDEVDGPMFEHVELYTAKSGEGIVSELFTFTRAGGDTDYALRAEFTPTAARMVAGLGSAAPRPVKWFSMPSLFRAERPQRGRLREHIQWNVDVFGTEDPSAEAEVIATAAAALRDLGLGPDTVRFRVSHRELAADLLRGPGGVDDENLAAAFALLDRREKLPREVFAEQAAAIGLDPAGLDVLDRFATSSIGLDALADDTALAAALGDDEQAMALLSEGAGARDLRDLATHLDRAGVLDWCRLDLSIVRGLAYYTGIVFELHENGGGERAMAGGGRYDGLVELFGGPPTAAVGFGMGDVVLGLVLGDRGLLPAEDERLPRPDAFVLGDEATVAERKARLIAALRGTGLHIRRSYKATTKTRKWLEEATKARARFAVILDPERPERAAVKNLDTGEQLDVPDVEVAGILERGAGG